MKHLGKGKVKTGRKKASEKSLRFIKGISRACCNPLCRSDFTPKRIDQRFCNTLPDVWGGTRLDRDMPRGAWLAGLRDNARAEQN